ncbi:MAG: hypothetical protein B7Z82_08935, partial [Halothiobacillus sp. 20-54-6]
MVLKRASSQKPLLNVPLGAPWWILVYAAFLPILVLFKRVPAEMAVGIPVLVALFIAVSKNYWKWLNAPWFFAAIALSLLYLLLSPFSLNPNYSALSAILALRWPIFALALVWMFELYPDALRLFERALLVVIVFIVLDTMAQYVFGVDVFGYPQPSPDRLSGPFNRPLVGTFTDRVWFIGLAVLWFLLQPKSEWVAVLSATIASAVGLLFLFLTGERAALLTYLLGTMLFLLGLLVHYPRWRLPVLGLLSLLAVVVGGIALSQQAMVQRSIDSTLYAITHLGDTVYGLNFKVSWAEFMAHPWSGVGARQFMEYCNTQLPELKSQYAQFGFPHSCVIHPHGLYLGMLA